VTVPASAAGHGGGENDVRPLPCAGLVQAASASPMSSVQACPSPPGPRSDARVLLDLGPSEEKGSASTPRDARPSSA